LIIIEKNFIVENKTFSYKNYHFYKLELILFLKFVTTRLQIPDYDRRTHFHILFFRNFP